MQQVQFAEDNGPSVIKVNIPLGKHQHLPLFERDVYCFEVQFLSLYGKSNCVIGLALQKLTEMCFIFCHWKSCPTAIKWFTQM